MKKVKFKKANILKLPKVPGVYIFLDNSEVLYIGKAISIKDRVASYLLKSISGKTKEMIQKADYFSIIKTNSELEALLLEAHLVNKLQPKYNVELKDDKHPLYIRITNEKFPRVLTARKAQKDFAGKNENLNVFGPFPNSSNVYMVLKTLRKIFPYSTHKIGKRGCLYNQIGLCVPCPNEIEAIKNQETKLAMVKLYKRNIRYIRAVLKGNLKRVRNDLAKQMKELSKEEYYEEANMVKRQIEGIDYITQPVTPIKEFLSNPNFISSIRESEIAELFILLNNHLKEARKPTRIECYDVAHLAGSGPAASMVTFINGDPDKTLYRHFRIRQAKKTSDVDSLREVIKRRVNKIESWGVPDLIIVDGGKPQVGVFFDELKNTGIPIVGLAKKHETLIFPKHSQNKLVYKDLRVPKGNVLNLLQRIRNEAHRFARRYHHHLLKKSLIPNK